MEDLIVKVVLITFVLVAVFSVKIKYTTLLYYFVAVGVLGKLILNGSLFLAIIGVFFAVVVEITIFVNPKKSDSTSTKSQLELKLLSVFIYLSILFLSINYFFNTKTINFKPITFDTTPSGVNSITAGLILFLVISIYHFYRAKPWK